MLYSQDDKPNTRDNRTNKTSRAVFLSFGVVKYLVLFFSNCSEEEYTRYTVEKIFIHCFEEEYIEYTTTTQTHVVLCSNLLS